MYRQRGLTSNQTVDTGAVFFSWSSGHLQAQKTKPQVSRQHHRRCAIYHPKKAPVDTVDSRAQPFPVACPNSTIIQSIIKHLAAILTTVYIKVQLYKKLNVNKVQNSILKKIKYLKYHK